MIQINKSHTKTDFESIAKLADIIWREHYIPIIRKPQVDYMLDKFQSAEAISEQMKNGFQYFIIRYDNTQVGYMALKHETDALFLSKFYLLRAYRGKSIGKNAMRFIEEIAKKERCKSIRLTVNKNNTNSMKVYEKLGFFNIGSVVTDIGNGFVMDDYKLEKAVL